MDWLGTHSSGLGQEEFMCPACNAESSADEQHTKQTADLAERVKQEYVGPAEQHTVALARETRLHL